jgi:SPP1 gp7 family putative phage head morphogenesis protein
MTLASDELDLTEALDAVDLVIERTFRCSVQKALDPLTPRGFLVIQNRLRKALRGLSKDDEAKALRRAIAALDVDWPSTSRDERLAVVAAARSVLAKVPEALLPRLTAKLLTFGQSLVKDVMRSFSRRYEVAIKPTLFDVDEQILQTAATHHASYVRNEWGRRSEVLSARARQIVAEGMKEGAPRAIIMRQLKVGLGKAGEVHSDNYWRVVANAHANRARSWGHLSSMRRAGIEQYRIEAVLDKRTTVQCRLMHGKVLSVQAGIEAFQRTMQLEDPEDVRYTQPWLQVEKDDEGVEHVYYKRRGGDRERIARVEESAYGAVDRRGKFSGESSIAALERAGISAPPFHGNCRSTIVSV